MNEVFGKPTLFDFIDDFTENPIHNLPPHQLIGNLGLSIMLYHLELALARPINDNNKQTRSGDWKTIAHLSIRC